MAFYPVFDVPADAPEVTESLGTKSKFWYDSSRYLFKAVRSAGEDWAEKVAAEAAEKIGLPHAEYDLAVWRSSNGPIDGVRSRNFVPSNAIQILGNELLSQLDADFSGGVTRYRQSTHTIARVVRAFEQYAPALPRDWIPPDWVGTAFDVFLGYLLLDVLVGNTDRHHENWGLVQTVIGERHLAPTFDHASSLGCHLQDGVRWNG